MASLTDMLTAVQNLVSATQTVAKNISTVFPQITGGSTAVPATLGTITFTSSQATGFMLVTTSSGFTAKVPYYPQ